MARRIVIIQGHPDPAGGHFDHAVVDAYARAALDAGHRVDVIDVARLEFPMLRCQAEWIAPLSNPDIEACQRLLSDAEHWVIVFPLWLGTMPAMLKAFLEQTARPGFAFEYRNGGRWRRLLTGRSARIVVTMGMPAVLYRSVYRAHSVHMLKRNILYFIGVSPVATTLFGSVDRSARRRQRFLRRIDRLGRAGG